MPYKWHHDCVWEGFESNLENWTPKVVFKTTWYPGVQNSPGPDVLRGRLDYRLGVASEVNDEGGYSWFSIHKQEWEAIMDANNTGDSSQKGAG